MSLRTRRGLTLSLALLFVAAACTPVAPGTPVPGTPGPGTPAPPPTTPAPGDTPTPPADTPAPGQPDADQTLRIYLGSEDPRVLDPNSASSTVEIAVLGNIHRGLMYWNEDLEPVPAGAESVTPNDDFTEFTFNLRQDAVFSNGDPIVAADYVRSFRRLADPRNAFDYSYMICFIAGTEALTTCGAAEDPADMDAALENLGVTAVDDHTLVVNLNETATFFLSVMAMWLFVPLHEDMVANESWEDASTYIGSGPYMMESYSFSSEIVLVGNPNWYGGAVPTNRIQLRIGGDPDAALAAYEQGDLDMASVPGPQVRRILDDPTLSQEVEQLEALAITYYNYALCGLPQELDEARCPTNAGTSNGFGPTQNLNFRIALTQAVDKQRMIDILRGGLGTPANTIVMPGIPGFDEEYNSNPPYPYDPAAATAALALALDELGVTDVNGDGSVTAADLGQLRLIYNTNAGHLPYIAFLAEAWRTTLGLQDVELVGVDFPTLLTTRGNGEYDIMRNGWGADFPHAHNQLNDLFRSGGGNNEGHYRNPAFDALLDEGARTLDPDEQTAKYIEAQRMLVDDAAALPLFFPVATYLIKPWVQGATITNSDHVFPGDQFPETIVISGRQ